jgi:mono/diheme cytochrome c family protein
MRILLAKWMALLTGILVFMMAILFALVQNQPAPSAGVPVPESVDQPRSDLQETAEISRDKIDAALGQVVYDLLGCRSCHSIAGEGNRRNPLDGAGKNLTSEEIREWILAPDKMDPNIRKPDYTFLSPDQVNLLVKYIKSL